MLVSSTDIPPQMNSYQIGRKSVIMNISDLLVKGVQPRGIIISLGLPKELRKDNFVDIINGIIDCTLNYDLKYIGGDINETEELIRLRQENFDLKVLNRAKDLHAERLAELHDDDREKMYRYVIAQGRRIGQLETELLQLQAPSEASTSNGQNRSQQTQSENFDFIDEEDAGDVDTPQYNN